MVNKDDQPHGWGRVVAANNSEFIDAQWKDGVRHGYYRWIDYTGTCYQREY